MGLKGAARWQGEAYVPAAEHHRAYDRWFIDRLPPEEDDVVVDLGCGSGEFSALISQRVTRGRVIGVDPDPSMLGAAERHSHARLEFLSGTAQELDRVVDPGSIDMILSRAVLHWIPQSEYPLVFAAAVKVLKPGGWFHSESAAAGNSPPMFELVDDLADQFGLKRPPRFPDAGFMFDVVEQAGFEIPDDGVRTLAQRRAFGRERMESWLRTQVSVLLTRDTDEATSAAIVDETVAGIEKMRRSDGTYDQTFVRLEVLARRPD